MNLYDTRTEHQCAIAALQQMKELEASSTMHSRTVNGITFSANSLERLNEIINEYLAK